MFIVITGLRNLAWTPLGRGIALFTVGTAIVTVLAVLQLLDPQRPFYAHHAWAWGLANVLLAIGAVWVIIEVWVRAWLLRHRIRTLHAVLTKRFPEVTVEGFKRTTTTLRASDEVAHIMDALYLQSGGGIDAFVATPPPAEAEERAAAVARWVQDPVVAEPLDSRWVAPPGGNVGASLGRRACACVRRVGSGRGSPVRGRCRGSCLAGGVGRNFGQALAGAQLLGHRGKQVLRLLGEVEGSTGEPAQPVAL